MKNQTPSELLDLKAQILENMADYMPSLVDNDVRIPLNLTACEEALKEHLAGIFLETVWDAPLEIVFQIRWILTSLRNAGYADLISGATMLAPDAQRQSDFFQACQNTFDISIVSMLAPAAKADPRAVISALRSAMLALAFLNLDAICEDVSSKAPGFHPSCYTQAELAQCDAILTEYLETVQAVAARNDRDKIMAAVQVAVESLNDLNDRCGRSLIETDGREDICNLIERAAQQAGLSDDGDDITEEWRDW